MRKKYMAPKIEKRCITQHIEYCEDVYAEAACARAMPELRDGLKGVHRRILFAMSQLKCTFNSAPVKSARVVGEVIGKYHPHGDSAVYESAIGMAQAWTIRYPLIVVQGNKGSQSGDSAAAMRYTEMRMSEIAGEVIGDISGKIVPMVQNYDQKLLEPAILPTKIPLHILNGSYGIGMGEGGWVSIPPHNLSEVFDCLIHMIDTGNREITAEEILKFVKGPDLPTGGEIISSRKELINMYKFGAGSYINRASYRVKELPRNQERIIINSIPYREKTANVLEGIKVILKTGSIPQVIDFNESCSNKGIDIEIDVKKGYAERVMSILYKRTNLSTTQKTFFKLMEPQNSDPYLIDKSTGELLTHPSKHSFASLLWAYLDFRKDMIVKKLENERDKISKRIEILKGLMKILLDIDKAIEIIRGSKDSKTANKNLQDHFEITEMQATAVLEIRLAALAKKSVIEIQKELKEREARLKEIMAILNDESRQWGAVKEEAISIKEKFGDKRRTKILSKNKTIDISEEDLQEAEECYVSFSVMGLFKRNRTEPKGDKQRPGDSLLTVIKTNTKNNIAIYSDRGRLYILKASEIAQTSGYGEPVQKCFKFVDGEKILNAFEITEGMSLVPSSKKGNMFKLKVDKTWAQKTKTAGKQLMRTPKGDTPAPLKIFDKDTNIDDMIVLSASSKGYGVKFKMSDISWFTSAAKGNQTQRLHPGVSVEYMDIISEDKSNKNINISGHRVDWGKIRVTGKSVRGAAIWRDK